MKVFKTLNYITLVTLNARISTFLFQRWHCEVPIYPCIITWIGYTVYDAVFVLAPPHVPVSCWA
jgi:hypothetical protein